MYTVSIFCDSIEEFPSKTKLYEALEFAFDKTWDISPTQVLAYGPPQFCLWCKEWSERMLFCNFIGTSSDSNENVRSSKSPRTPRNIHMMLDQCSHAIVFIPTCSKFSKRIVKSLIGKQIKYLGISL